MTNAEPNWTGTWIRGGVSGVLYAALFYFSDDLMHLAHTTADACLVMSGEVLELNGALEKNNPRRCARDSDRPRGPHGTEPAAALCPATGTGAGKLSRLSGHDGCARHGLSLD